ADPTARDPDADPDPIVHRVHQVDVMPAVGRLLVLEEEVRAQHRGIRVPGPAAEVLGPSIRGVASTTETVARVTADEVAAVGADRQLLGVWPAELRADA